MIQHGFVTVLLPAEFFTVKLTVYFPALPYLCTGSLAVEVLLSPKLHRYDVDDPVLLSKNFTVSGSFPDVGDAKKATTGAFKAFTTT